MRQQPKVWSSKITHFYEKTPGMWSANHSSILVVCCSNHWDWLPMSKVTKMTWVCWTKEGWPDCRIKAWRCTPLSWPSSRSSFHPNHILWWRPPARKCVLENQTNIFSGSHSCTGAHILFFFFLINLILCFVHHLWFWEFEGLWKSESENVCPGEIDPCKWRHMRHTRIICDSCTRGVQEAPSTKMAASKDLDWSNYPTKELWKCVLWITSMALCAEKSVGCIWCSQTLPPVQLYTRVGQVKAGRDLQCPYLRSLWAW